MKDVTEMILTSTKEVKFSVDLIQTDDVLDFQNWCPNFYKKKRQQPQKKLKCEERKKGVPISVCLSIMNLFATIKQGTSLGVNFINRVNQKTFKLT